jgi:hypothetical protein
VGVKAKKRWIESEREHKNGILRASEREKKRNFQLSVYLPRFVLPMNASTTTG